MLTMLLLAVVGCARQESQQQEAKRVTVYMYSEYIDPELIPEFEKLTGMKLQVDVYEDSESMLAKMSKAGGDSQYDVIVVSDVVVPALINLKLVQPLDMSVIPNAVNVGDDFKQPPFDPGSRFSLPYQWGTVGLMYRKGLLPGDEVSWSVLFDSSKQTGSFTLMDSMRDMIGIALRYHGKSMNSTSPADIMAAGELLLGAKKSSKCLGFEGGVGGKNKVLAGEAGLAVVYNGDAVRGISEQAEQNKTSTLAFAIPKEGGVIWTDVMMVPSKAPNVQGGHQFINFILDAQNGAKLSNFNRYATPNKASMPMIAEADRNDPDIYPDAATMKTLEYLTDVGADTKLFDEVWTMVKSR
ncbi:MAG: spermidine/putrescine ABC transporter substrate-binding protein [Phycisphaerales bacterium]|nr:spermidine/putrescine ABC transporter substrate-binding protein [Phycisphaerales bacterium]